MQPRLQDKRGSGGSGSTRPASAAPSGQAPSTGLLRGASLTMLGAAFLAFGGAATAAAIVYGQRDLLRVGLLLASVPFVAGLLLLRIRPQLDVARTVSPADVAVTQEARIVVRVTNLAPRGTGLLLAEDTVPLSLGARPRFVLPGLAPRGDDPAATVDIGYAVRSSSRGRFSLGPFLVRVSDPFGMWEFRRAFTSDDTLLVTPKVLPLPPSALRALSAGGGSRPSAALASAGEDDVGIREYRQGDPVHRVHWRATARYGEVMVRREEQPERPTATLLLDTRASGYAGVGRRSTFEDAVTIVASAGDHLGRHGYVLRVLTTCGTQVVVGGRGEDPAQTARRLMHALAEIRTCRAAENRTGSPGGSSHASSGASSHASSGASSHASSGATSGERGCAGCFLPAAPPVRSSGLLLAVLGGAGTHGAPGAGMDAGLRNGKDAELAAVLGPWRASASSALAVFVGAAPVTGPRGNPSADTQADAPAGALDGRPVDTPVDGGTDGGEAERLLRSARWSVARVTTAEEFPALWLDAGQTAQTDRAVRV